MPDATLKKRSLIEIHSAVALFGLAGLFGKWILQSPPVIVFGRVLFACIALGLIIRLKDKPEGFSAQGHLLILTVMGFLLAVHWSAFFQSIQVSSVAVGLLSYSSFPVFTVFLEPVLTRDRIDLGNLLFALICFAGIFCIVPRFSLGNATTVGVLWGLLAGSTFAVLSIFNRKLSQSLSSLTIAFYQFVFATLFLTPLVFKARPVLTFRDTGLLFILGVLCTALSHTLFIKGLRHIRAQTAAILSSLEPVYGIILALLMLREIPSVRTLIGGGLILMATLSVTRRSHRREEPARANR